MKTYLRLTVLAGLLAGCSSAPLRTPQERSDFAKAVITNWYTYSQVSALKLIDEYGPPDKIDSSRLTWNDKGQWKKIAVWDVEPYYDSNLGPENLEMATAESVTPQQRKNLAAFDHRVRVSKNGDEISARYDSEDMNFLAINLADEILRGLRDPTDARRYFDRTMEFGAAGKSSRYMQGLLYPPEP